MSVATAIPANEILNRVAAEVGLTPVGDPWSDQAQHFLQMRYLLNTCGEELLLAHPWEWGIKAQQFTTQKNDTGDYDLPGDFLQMIDQTGWDRSNNVPLLGPLSPQDWTYLLGRDLVSSTIYASFRVKEGKLSLFPQPPTTGLDVNYEYQSSNWVFRGTSAQPVHDDEVKEGSDIVLFDKTLISRMLKLKWLGAKGFDTTTPQSEFDTVFGTLTGKDKGGKVLSAGFRRGGIPYLDGWRSVPDTGYGQY